jgi:coenzyme F420-dependent glucose-6-phosphate dehydrogenase
MTLRIGYKASAEQFAPRQLVDFAVQAEQVGLDSVMVSDHFQPWRHEGGHAPFSLAWLAAAGERTERVLLGSLYPGRVMLGVGTGEALNEVVVGAVRTEDGWPEFKERFARLREAVQLMRELWTHERVSFEGEYYRTTDATVYDRPEQPVPVYVAAGGPLVARYAGRSGDGFICTSGKGAELYRDKLLPALDEGLEKSGRTRADVDRMIEIKLSWDPDHDQAVRNCRFWAPLALTAEQKHGTTDPVEMGRLGDALSDEQVASRWIVSNDPDEVVAAVKQYVDWGFNHLVFHGPGGDQTRFLDTFAEQVLPGLRELG